MSAPTFSVEFLGCKVSFADAQAIRERLVQAGYRQAPHGDVHVVNGCCVTHEALSQTRQAAARARRAGAGRVLVTGCAANLAARRLADLGPRAEPLPGAAEKVPELVAAALGAPGCVGPAPGLDRVRAFVKVQDGCSFGCSFCVIPQVRGATRSRATAAIVAEAARRVAHGHRELVVTGVNVGLFRDRAERVDLAEVLVRLAELDGVERVRLSSIEVNHLSTRLCEALAHPRVAPHLHVPLQSGDDAVLRAMRRRYDGATYLARIRRARARVPDLNVTGDVIVGFPGEDEAAFERTLATVRDAGLTRVHVFPYSPRPGTATAGDDPVPASVKRERARRLRALADAQGLAHRRERVGLRDRVLVERRAAGRLHGYGSDYTSWSLRAAEAQVGTVVDAVALRATAAGIEGRIA
jgi:threonylcarbamoyladenosine tRNA methylthiotransferase MtaB